MSAPLANPFAAEFYSRFYRDAPQVLLDCDDYAIIYKPHFMHSAPLREEDRNSLLCWYLSRSETCNEARNVLGKKPIERGLLHRLDFATAGIVLVAKNQNAYNFLYKAQQEGRFTKEYRAFCNSTADKNGQPLYKAGEAFCVKSRFRAFGPGGKEVHPVFAESRGALSAAAAKKKKRITTREYSTNITIEEITDDGKFASVLCSISLGFRHQIRAHLASIGLAICGDTLYNPLCRPPATAGETSGEDFMQLIAVSLSFPEPKGEGQVSFSLPQASKKSL